MSILWVGKGSGSGAAGDEIYDRKIQAAARALGAAFRPLAIERVSRGQEILNMLSGSAHYRSRYASPANRRLVRNASSGAEAAICSWEPFDELALELRCPTVMVLHNVTSEALPSLFDGHPVARLAAARAGAWERKAYGGGGFGAIAVLSRADEAAVRRVANGTPVVFAPPGMPPLTQLRPEAAFRPEILISGTYDWRPKRRDVVALARELAALGDARPTVFAENLPPEAEALLAPQPIASLDMGAAIRVGIIPDRFRAGHKLKTTFYLANNAVVLTYADVSSDFSHISDHEFMIRRIRHASEIPAQLAELAAMDRSEFASRLARFKTACAETFDWSRSAGALLTAAQQATPPRSRS